MKKKVTLGVIVGSRGFFPADLAKEGRKEILSILKAKGVKTVALGLQDTENGAVSTLADAKKCAALFKANGDDIDGVLVTLPNFGDEKAIANTLRMSKLDVPVLVHAYPDELDKMAMGQRRDSFCGKMSACNNLRQYGISYTLTTLHTVDPKDPIFDEDLDNFIATCRVVRGLSNARFGAIGARTGDFNTVRYSEKLLELNGISLETLDLSEVFAGMDALSDSDSTVKRRLTAINKYVPIRPVVPKEALLKMAKLSTVLSRWVADNELDGIALQCWTAIETICGFTPCGVMSMMSEALVPAACEVDVGGLIGMYALQCASCTPSALLDWNNNYGDDPEKMVFFHCSNLPKSIFESAEMGAHEIIKDAVGAENCCGVCEGRMAAGPFSYARVSTFDDEGRIAAYVGEGELTDDPLDTFGGVGVAHIEDLQALLEYICAMGFEHHVAVNRSEVAGALAEAFGTYLGWDVYYHNA